MKPKSLNPETLRNITAELRRARDQYPSRDTNLASLQHFVQQMPLLLRAHHLGAKEVKAVQVYANAILIAVMAIRIAEEGASDFKYAEYVSNLGPLFHSNNLEKTDDD